MSTSPAWLRRRPALTNARSPDTRLRVGLSNVSQIRRHSLGQWPEPLRRSSAWSGWRGRRREIAIAIYPVPLSHPLPGPMGEVAAGGQAIRVLGTQLPLAYRQQCGELVAGPGGIARIAGPAAGVITGDQDGRILRGEDSLAEAQIRCRPAPASGHSFWAAASWAAIQPGAGEADVAQSHPLAVFRLSEIIGDGVRRRAPPYRITPAGHLALGLRRKLRTAHAASRDAHPFQ